MNKTNPSIRAAEAATEELAAIQARGLATFIPEAPEEIMYMPGGLNTITASKSGKPFRCTVNVTPETAVALQASLAQLISERAPHRPFFDKDHKEEDAMGWPTSFRWKDAPEPGVYATVEWSAPGQAAIKGKAYRAFSPSFFTDSANPARVTAMDFCGGSLVNKPAFRRISPLWAKEADAEQHPKDNSIDNMRTKVRTAICAHPKYKAADPKPGEVSCSSFDLTDIIMGTPWQAIIRDWKTGTLYKHAFTVADDGSIQLAEEPKVTSLVYAKDEDATVKCGGCGHALEPAAEPELSAGVVVCPGCKAHVRQDGSPITAGDVPGHEFHGNQHTAEQTSEKAHQSSIAARAGSRAAKASNTPEAHKEAEELHREAAAHHQEAAQAARKAGDKETQVEHLTISKQHVGRANTHAQAAKGGAAPVKVDEPHWDKVLEKSGGHEGHAYVVHETLQGMHEGRGAQQAFNDAAENQNYHGNRPDVVADRAKMAEILSKHYGVKVSHHIASDASGIPGAIRANDATYAVRPIGPGLYELDRSLHGTTVFSETRLKELLASGAVTAGDVPGHEFHGNQHTGGGESKGRPESNTGVRPVSNDEWSSFAGLEGWEKNSTAPDKVPLVAEVGENHLLADKNGSSFAFAPKNPSDEILEMVLDRPFEEQEDAKDHMNTMLRKLKGAGDDESKIITVLKRAGYRNPNA